MNGIPDPGRTLTVQEVATLLDLSERTVWRLVAEGKLSRPKTVAKNRTRWFEADVAVYRYRLMRGDFDPPTADDAPPAEQGDEEDDGGPP